MGHGGIGYTVVVWVVGCAGLGFGGHGLWEA